MKYKSHPFADLFPMMTAQEQEALAADIAENGQRQPIVLYQGQILDGRNRLLACETAGVDPIFTTHEGDDASALALVISLNAQRRDMSASQRAIVAARIMERMPERRGRPQKGAESRHNFHSRDALSKTFKVNKDAIQQAKALLEESPDDLAVQVASGIPIAAAYEQLQKRRAEAAKKQRDLNRIGKYADAVRNGEMTLEEALEKISEEEKEEARKKESQADARKQWLQRLADHLSWVEDFVAGKPNDDLAWYEEPESPGWFDNEVTASRIRDAIKELERVAAITYAKRKK
jgi:hypothetical protein